MLLALFQRIFGPAAERIRVREWRDYWHEHLEQCIERYGDCLSQDDLDVIAELREMDEGIGASYLLMYLDENDVRPENIDMFIFSTLFNLSGDEHKKWPVWWPRGEEWRTEKYIYGESCSAVEAKGDA